MPDHVAFERQFASWFSGRTQIEDPRLERAVSIHRNTAFKAARDALADNYPVVRSLCGEEPFNACAHEFVVLRPPSDPRLCLYGAGFDAFIAGYAPFSSLTWLADIARLERLCVEALFATDAVALDGGAILRLFDHNQAPELHPAVRFERFASPAASIWLAHQACASVDALETIDWVCETALITRPADALCVSAIDAGATVFLEACIVGAGFGEAALAAAEVGADVSTSFSTLITAGAFAANLLTEDS